MHRSFQLPQLTTEILNDGLQPQQQLILKADDQEIPVLCRLDNKVEIEYYRNGGILHTVLRNFMREAQEG